MKKLAHPKKNIPNSTHAVGKIIFAAIFS